MAATEAKENKEENKSQEVDSEIPSNEKKMKLEALKVSDLKNELEKRELDKNGVKSVLIERLKSAILEEGGNPEEYDFTISDNHTNKSATNKKVPISSNGTDINSNEELHVKEDVCSNEVNTQEDADKNETDTKEDECINNEVVMKDNCDSKQTEDVNSNEADRKADMNSTETAKKEDMDINKIKGEEGKDINSSEEKQDVALQLSIDEEEAQLNEENLIEYNGDDGKTKPEEKTDNAETQNITENLSSPTKPSKKSDEDLQGKKKTQNKNSEVVAVPNVVKAVVKSDKVSKSPSVLAKSLWITGLPNATRAADLKALFSNQGRVLSVKIVKSAKQTPGKCYGFVTMATSKDATKAIQNLHRTELNGRVISVERKSSEPTTLMKKTDSKASPAVKKASVKKETSASKPVSGEKKPDAVKAKSDGKTSSATPVKKGDKVSSTEKTRDKRSREHKDRARDARPPPRRPTNFRQRYNDRPRYGAFRQPARRPFSNSFGGFRQRSLQQLREDRFQRERREDERRRAEEATRHRYIERKQREEAFRLEREKERLRIERELLERERAEIIKLEREKQRLERERLEREREDLRRQAELRRSLKRPYLEREVPVWDDRKKATSRYDVRPALHGESSSISRFEYPARERSNFTGREFERLQPKHVDQSILPRSVFPDTRREVSIRARDDRQMFGRNDYRRRSREPERQSSTSRREQTEWKGDRRVHERASSSSAQRRMNYY